MMSCFLWTFAAMLATQGDVIFRELSAGKSPEGSVKDRG
jgi:hypothetical protein